ncbi:hypothetical protein RUM44_010250 [Polyplax serrata]|uniref:Uncharacterized protein n=1 Tax=Polyplax serrata TaxID=468196 RepID=A0ABR1AVN7_POLSC
MENNVYNRRKRPGYGGKWEAPGKAEGRESWEKAGEREAAGAAGTEAAEHPAYAHRVRYKSQFILLINSK